MRRIVRAMQSNPQWLVRRARRYENSRVKLSGRKLRLWINRYQHRPLSMLSECFGRKCPNSRLIYPERREKFVTRVIALVRERWGNVLDHLQLIFLGSGSLLQEVIVITRLCEEVVIREITVVCCDNEYMYNNEDGVRILQARFAQANLWMKTVAPQTCFTWNTITTWDDISPTYNGPTLLCAADVEIPEAYLKQLQQRSHSAGFIILNGTGKIAITIG